MTDWQAQIEAWLREIAPLTNEIDNDADKLNKVLQQMGDRAWLALKVSKELGGMGITEAEYRCLQISLARTSGALTFLQTQHQSAVSKLAQSDNVSLRSRFFPGVARGKPLVGVGFSHLRRRGQPMVRAIQLEGGYELRGNVPWITGYGFFDWFILGATLEDGRELYGLLPFANKMESGGQITFSQPMQLLAVAATNTVSAKLDRWYLPAADLVSINPPGSIHQSSKNNILNHGFYALGCAYAGLDILEAIADKKQLDFLHSALDSLKQEVTAKEREALNCISNQQITYDQKLLVRAEAIDLAQRCSLAAVTASSGAANYLHASVGRVYREALLFTVSGQTTDVMSASLKHLL